MLTLERLLPDDVAIWVLAFGDSSWKAGAVSYSSCSGIHMNVKRVAQGQRSSSPGILQQSSAGLSSGSGLGSEGQTVAMGRCVPRTWSGSVI